jgi:hypothetical protein
MRIPVQTAPLARHFVHWFKYGAKHTTEGLLPSARNDPSNPGGVTKNSCDFGANQMTCGIGCCDPRTQYCSSTDGTPKCVDFPGTAIVNEQICFRNASNNTEFCIMK